MMTFWQFAVKNLVRQPVRTLLTIGGVALTIAVLVSLLGFNVGYRSALKADLANMGYEVLVTAKGCPYEAATLLMKGGDIPYYLDEAELTAIEAAGGSYIASQTPLLMQAGFTEDGRMQLFLGIDQTFMQLKPWLTFLEDGSRWFSAPDANEVILGFEAAELESRKAGDEMYIESLDRVMTVAGIYERTGTEDDGSIFLPLKTAQTVFGREGRITGIGVKLHDLKAMPDFVDAIYDIPNIQVVTLAQVENTILRLVSTAEVLVYAIAAVAMLIALLGLTNTVLMTVFERTAEIGVLRALGASRWDVFRGIWLETLLIALAGGAAGIILAFLGTGAVETGIKAVMPFAPSGTLVAITPAIMGLSMLGALVVGLVSGTWPGWRAAKLNPIDAIRKGE